MFYFISFLRPPPQRAAITSKAFFICPQVANDLRTEFYENDTLDIYFAWLPEPTLASASHASKLVTRKLTTWKGSATAYKEIAIPLPPDARPHDLWRLALWARSSKKSPKTEDHNNNTDDADPLPWLIELQAYDFGIVPFPVLSEPILIMAEEESALASHEKTNSRARGGSRANAMVPKQERIERTYLLPRYSAESDPVDGEDDCTGRCLGSTRMLRITEQTSFDLDKKAWDSGLGLAAWLANLLFPRGSTGMNEPEHNNLPMVLNPRVIDIRDCILNPNGFSAVELGTGIGIVSLMLAALLESLPSSMLSCSSELSGVADSPVRPPCSRKILATDLASAIPLIEHNFKQNAYTYESGKTKLTAAVLDWDDEDIFSSCPDLSDFRTLDLIIMADVTYNTSSFPSLLRTIQSLLTSRNLNSSSERSEGPRILMAYKERDPAERELWDMAAKQVGVLFERVGGVQGAGEVEVEIWIGGVVSELN